jgi:hypothetical protein
VPEAEIVQVSAAIGLKRFLTRPAGAGWGWRGRPAPPVQVRVARSACPAGAGEGGAAGLSR